MDPDVETIAFIKIYGCTHTFQTIFTIPWHYFIFLNYELLLTVATQYYRARIYWFEDDTDVNEDEIICSRI